MKSKPDHPRRLQSSGWNLGEVEAMENDVLKAFDDLIKTHETAALVKKHKPELKIAFDAERIKDDAFAASYERQQTDGAWYITLSPRIIECGLTDYESFSTIVLHELGHIVHRLQAWGSPELRHSLNDQFLREYIAHDFVISCGWKTQLRNTLLRTEALREESGLAPGIGSKRLERLDATLNG